VSDLGADRANGRGDREVADLYVERCAARGAAAAARGAASAAARGAAGFARKLPPSAAAPLLELVVSSSSPSSRVESLEHARTLKDETSAPANM